MAKQKPKTPAKPTRRISSDAGLCTQRNHRVAVTKCPYCDWEPNEADGPRHGSYRWWVENAHTLIAAEVWGKHEYVATLTECASCFKTSWTHWGLTSFTSMDVPESWKTAVDKEAERRHMASIALYRTSICQQCVHLRGIELKTHAWKECTMGKEEKLDGKVYLQSGPVVQEEGTSMLKNQCDRFQRVKG